MIKEKERPPEPLDFFIWTVEVIPQFNLILIFCVGGFDFLSLLLGLYFFLWILYFIYCSSFVFYFVDICVGVLFVANCRILSIWVLRMGVKVLIC